MGSFMSNEVVNVNDVEAKAMQVVEKYCNSLYIFDKQGCENVKNALFVFERYVSGCCYNNNFFPNTVEGRKKFINYCFMLKTRYPDLNLTPDDVFTGICSVKGNPMVYGKLAIKIGTNHSNFSHTETRQETNEDNKIKIYLTIYGIKNNVKYKAFEGSYIQQGKSNAEKEAEYSKFLRTAFVKAFPDKFAFGYCEPKDASAINNTSAIEDNNIVLEEENNNNDNKRVGTMQEYMEKVKQQQIEESMKKLKQQMEEERQQRYEKTYVKDCQDVSLNKEDCNEKEIEKKKIETIEEMNKIIEDIEKCSSKQEAIEYSKSLLICYDLNQQQKNMMENTIYNKFSQKEDKGIPVASQGNAQSVETSGEKDDK